MKKKKKTNRKCKFRKGNQRGIRKKQPYNTLDQKMVIYILKITQNMLQDFDSVYDDFVDARRYRVNPLVTNFH